MIVNTPFYELNGQFSPDGRWAAYETNESARFEIVVQPFPAPTGKWQVSTGGGVEPRWRAGRIIQVQVRRHTASVILENRAQHQLIRRRRFPLRFRR